MRKAYLLLFLALMAVTEVDAGFDEGGDAYKRGDFAGAAREFMPLAERGDHRAMYALGSLYAAGLGVEQDLNKAFELFRQAALNGRIDAMYKLGLMYEQGLGIKQNYRKALQYYQKSAKGGYPLSQYRFGLMYAEGKGVKQNSITAYAWMTIAGHYFIYESGKIESQQKPDDIAAQIQFVQQQELGRITNELIDELQVLRQDFSETDIQHVRDKVRRFNKYKKRYHSSSVRYLPPDGSIEKMFLPDTLY